MQEDNKKVETLRQKKRKEIKEEILGEDGHREAG